ncbi:hypothetical protein UR09_01690 [Candidatus Nitromaritima sp. SCGC AAA799-A02]|nr:hypothetical protein UR09_01690 [Candidatus Nitromaritima sp. SCGC AAA799-A02]
MERIMSKTTFIPRIVLASFVTVLMVVCSANQASAKTLFTIVSDRSAADLAAGADYFVKHHSDPVVSG